jgi:hypothetical protein
VFIKEKGYIDNLGKIVYDNTCVGNQQISSIGNFNDGIYLVQITIKGISYIRIRYQKIIKVENSHHK